MSRSLGTLTLDLVARIGGFEQGMDKAARHSQRRMNDVQRSAQQVRRAITGAFAAIGVGLSARAFQNMIRDTARAIDEQAKLAGRLNTTSTELAGLELAGDLAGVSLNEISTASRQLDINLGRAIQGVAAQADAIDRLGLSAQELARTPLAERIATINQALRDNVPASERAAVAAEIFGSRSQQAIRQLDPDGIRSATEEIERFGLAISEVDAANVEKMNDEITRLQRSLQGFRVQLTAQLAPAIGMMAEELTKVVTNSGNVEEGAQRMAETIITSSAFAINAIDGITRVTGILIDALIIASQAASLLPAVDWKDLMMVGVNPAAAGTSIAKKLFGSKEDNQRDTDLAMGVIREAWASLQERVNTPLAGARMLADYRKAMAEQGDGVTIPVDLELDDADLEEVIKATVSQFEKMAQGLQQQIALFGETTEAARMRYQVEQGLIEGITAAQGQYLIGLSEQLDALKSAEEFATEVQRIIDSAIPATERQITSLREDMLLLTMAFHEGQISAEQFATTMQQIEGRIRELEDSVTETTDSMSVYAEQAARNIQDAFAQFLFDPFEGGLSGMLDSFTKIIQQMIAQAIAADIAAALGFPGAGGGGNASGIVSAIGGIFGGKFADGGRPDPRKISIVGERGPELFVPDGVSGTVIPNDRIGGRQVDLTQNIIVQGRPDNRTASQIASESARRQRTAMTRLGA